MEYCLVVYSSITFAHAIKKEMTKHGEYISVINTPKQLNAGCSYSVRVRKEKLNLVRQISDLIGIRIKGIYEEEINKNGYKNYKKIIKNKI